MKESDVRPVVSGRDWMKGKKTDEEELDKLRQPTVHKGADKKKRRPGLGCEETRHNLPKPGPYGICGPKGRAGDHLRHVDQPRQVRRSA